jgi:hypothetical protein
MASDPARRRSKLAPWLVVLALVAGKTRDAAAQAAPTPSAADKETARQLMDLGNAAFEEGKYDAALKAYRGADAIMNVTSTGFAVGKTLVKLGRLVEARDKLIAVSRLPVTDGESPVLTAARENAAALERSIADRIPALAIAVAGLAEGSHVKVTIDGVEVPRELLALPVRVNPGRHQVAADCEPRQPIDVVLNEGEERAVELRCQTYTQPPEEPELVISPLVYAGAAIAGAGLVVGAITGGVSLAAASDAKVTCPEGSTICARDPDAESAAARSTALGHASTVSFAVAGVGAVLAAVGLVLTFQDHPPERPGVRHGPRVALGLGPHEGGGGTELRLDF